MNKRTIYQDLFLAYENARMNKRNTASQLMFELNKEKKLYDLFHKIISTKYEVWKSICFISFYPVQREIFAAEFKDRVVHHLVHNYINDFYDDYFIYDSYSCRIWKWTLFWVERMEKFLVQSTENYKKDSRILKLDITWYFMNISKEKLFNLIKKFLEWKFVWKKFEEFLWRIWDEKILFYYKKFFPENFSEDWKFFLDEKNNFRNFLLSEKWKNDLRKILNFLLYLLHKIIFDNPTKKCILKWQKSDWQWLPKSKSLFYAKKDYWLPIWNLTSQLFWNVYLDIMDKFIKEELKIKYYWRYVDDFVLIDKDKQKLKNAIPKIKKFLEENLDLEISDKKTYFQHFSKWFQFLWINIKPYRRYIWSRAKWSFYTKNKILNEKIKNNKNKYENNEKNEKKWVKNSTTSLSLSQNIDKNLLLEFLTAMNSYLWLFKHHRTWNLRLEMIKMVDFTWWKYFIIHKTLTKVILRKKYKK